MPPPWDSNVVVLERGGPHEIVPDELYKWKGAAHRYLKGEHPQEAKDRVRAVWLDEQDRPAWQAHTPVPDLREKMETELG